MALGTSGLRDVHARSDRPRRGSRIASGSRSPTTPAAASSTSRVFDDGTRGRRAATGARRRADRAREDAALVIAVADFIQHGNVAAALRAARRRDRGARRRSSATATSRRSTSGSPRPRSSCSRNGMPEGLEIGPATRGRSRRRARARDASRFPHRGAASSSRASCARAAGCNLVAQRDGVVVGYLFAMWIFDEMHVNKIAVAESERRRGHRRRADGALLRLRRVARRSTSISLEVRQSNRGAQDFYEHLGFASVVRPQALLPRRRSGSGDDRGGGGTRVARDRRRGRRRHTEPGTPSVQCGAADSAAS